MSLITENLLELDPKSKLLEKEFIKYCELEEKKANGKSLDWFETAELDRLRKLMVDELPERFGYKE